jgi:hypothetical protein
MKPRLLLTAAFSLLPNHMARPLLRLLGHRIHPTVRLGFSLLLVDRLHLTRGSSIGHLNLIRCRRVVLRERARIGYGNVVMGPVSVWLGSDSKLGNRNRATRAPAPVTYGPSLLKMGQVSAITASHLVDCTRSVILGDFTTVAGVGTQMWTHGYYHAATGIDRFRVDGRIVFGNNVYIGAHSVVTGGVTVTDHVIVGSHSSVSKDLTVPGMYVSQPLRYLPLDLDATMAKLEPVEAPCCDRVFQKRQSSAEGSSSRKPDHSVGLSSLDESELLGSGARYSPPRL